MENKYIYQSPQPKIEFYSSQKNEGKLYQTFSPISDNLSGKNLQSYSFEKSVDQRVGTWNITIKEDISGNDLFIDKVELLDVVKIYENGTDLDFIGIVNNITFSASGGNNVNKQISISGNSIEYLFDMYTISLDQTAMSFLLNEAQNIEIKTTLSDLTDNTGSVDVFSVVKTVWNSFNEVAGKYTDITATKIKDLIELYYGNDINNWLSVESGLNFKYQISTNMYNGDEVTVFGFIQNLLPEEVYEFYGFIENNSPKIRIRQKPFSFNVFKKLKWTKINPAWTIDYTFTRTNQEVYTAFLAYLEGSVLSADFYQKITANSNGYSTAKSAKEKCKLYGYKPKFTSFVGYKTPETDTDTENKENSDLIDEFTKLNTLMCEWWGNLDELYNGDITVVNVLKDEKPKIGEVAEFCNGQFYVTKEKHSWRYGQSMNVNYQIERGGDYTGVEFKKLSKISKAYKELLNNEELTEKE